MNERHDEQLEPLLDQLLGAEEPADDLVERICQLTDGPLCDTLDQAIGPDSVTCDHEALVRRIMAATSERPAVLARIGMFGVAWRMAAMLAVAGGLYLVVLGLTGSDRDSAQTPQIADVLPPATDDSSNSSLSDIEQAIASFTAATDWAFDQRVQRVNSGLDRVAAESFWADSPVALVERAAESADMYEGAATSTGAWF
ncbi:MAG: hypothetical protein IT445_15385 [Phycisphaeraceae bacterium]|nr:hypothetical protein [Phycisphaeraceae bacterium]